VNFFFFLHISLCFSASSVKHPDALGFVDLLFDSMPFRRECTMFGCELFAFSAKHTLYFLPVLSCCAMCVFSRIDPKILAFFAHLFSFPGISFDFHYSLKLWFFLEYWNL
jgi:hypothetical protein